MIVRTVMLGFCVVTAPLCFATAVFDSNNRFFHWWLDLLGSVLLTPLVLGVAIALSLTLASHVVIRLCCGSIARPRDPGRRDSGSQGKWCTSLTWRGFSHGSALAGFAAGMATMVAPVHRLSSAGFMAEALGANRDGGNSAVNFMKRLGLAAQGLTPAPSTTAGGLGGGNFVATTAGADLLASEGPPNMAAALGSDGQSAVAGAEATFSQQAFNAFGAGQAKLIGASTRDHPYGSLSTGDRAKLAWSRTHPRIRRRSRTTSCRSGSVPVLRLIGTPAPNSGCRFSKQASREWHSGPSGG